MLDTQFRCPSNISDFISDAFYDGAYFASPAMKTKRPILPEFLSTMVFIDTSALPFARRGERTRQGVDREEVLGNPCESEIVLAVLELVGDRLPEIAAKGEIGIIVPYKNHVAEVVQLVNTARRRGRLGSLSTPAAELVSSVDGYQGQERDVIIHAFTRSNPRGAVGFLQDWRRLNVGMTRAKRQLIMVGDLSTLSAAPRRVEAMDAEFKAAMALLRRRLQSDGQLVSAAFWMNGPHRAPRHE
jgi:superfamily I DNA and/or RNA helicase